MPSPLAGLTALSSAGVSPGVPLDPTSRVTNASLNLTSSWSGDVTVQVTLDVYTAQGLTATWNNASTIHYSASTLDGASLSFLSPVAGLRLSSSTYSAGVATLTVLQEIIA